MDIHHIMHTGGSLPEGISMHSTAFPLGESSGNLQSLGFESRDGIENETPYLKRESRFPIPDIKLGSNDGADHAIRRELKVEPPIPCQTTTLYDPKRPFLHNPKYLEYMGRQRQEFGKDGKPVWSDEIETAFQDGKLCLGRDRGHFLMSSFSNVLIALVAIPWMGKKKCSQRTTLFGRNMLIAEYILQSTGR